MSVALLWHGITEDLNNFFLDTGKMKWLPMPHALVAWLYYSEFIQNNIVKCDFPAVLQSFVFYFMIVSVHWKISWER